jgi:hypothetical protein
MDRAVGLLTLPGCRPRSGERPRTDDISQLIDRIEARTFEYDFNE